MAERGGSRGSSTAQGVPAPRVTTRQPDGLETLVTSLGGGNLDFSAMLAIADILPVMVAYVDAGFVYRFCNRPLAEWLDLPRKAILGHHMREVLGEDAFAHRKPMFEAALKGQRMFFASEFRHCSTVWGAVERARVALNLCHSTLELF